MAGDGNREELDGRVVIARDDLVQEVPLVQKAIRSTGLSALVATLAEGPYGFTPLHLKVLEIVEDTFAATLELVKRLGHRFPEGDFASLYSLFVLGEATAIRLLPLTEQRPDFSGGFPRSRIQGLLVQEPALLAHKLADDLGEFLARHRNHPDPARKVAVPQQLAGCAAAWATLLKMGARTQVEDAAYEPQLRRLQGLDLEVLGRIYRGFEAAAAASPEDPPDLLPVTADDIVGNEDYLKAGMRLARDVAGFDFERGENPKRLNPVLFALGAPGCGKTVTAHAVGNYFLQYCRERDIRARFLVIRRTDWASSYQNASAQKLLDIFREDVQKFDGVVGVYWPDIDTAFAARTDPGLRSEERNILGASFGVFDGTVIPKNGKWFLLCDANYMNMDEATLSRITQDPYRLYGPVSPEDFRELMRDKKLDDVRDMLPLTDEQWLEVGRRCVDFKFSGRNVDSICRKILTEIQDVEPPEEYYRVGFDERREILKNLSRPMTFERLVELLEAYNRFEKEAEAEAEDQRFRSRVQDIVFNLSAQRAAMELYPGGN